MHKLPVRLLVVLLLWAFTPGLVEVTENMGHLLVAQHLAHAVDQGADHAPEGDEHGCSGTFHVCSCHHSPAVDVLPLPAGVRSHRCHRTADAEPVGVPDPTLPGPDHPPRA